MANSDPRSLEVLGVWTAPGQPQEVTLRTTWKGAGAWGQLLADIARHVAKAYANEGRNEPEVLARIQQFSNGEFSRPTDTPVQIDSFEIPRQDRMSGLPTYQYLTASHRGHKLPIRERVLKISEC